MKKREKVLSLLIVMFILGVNSLTGCGPNPANLEKDPSPLREVALSQNVLAEKTGYYAESNKPGPKTKTEDEPETSRETKTVSDSAKHEGTGLPEHSIVAKHVERESDRSIDDSSPTATTAKVLISQTYSESMEEHQQNSCEPASAQTVDPEMEAGSPQENYEAVQETEMADSDTVPTEPSLYAGESELAFFAYDQTEYDEPQPQHIHSYTANRVEPTCTSGGYTVFSCACGERYQADETTALGHDWVENTERVIVGQEAHEICGDCGLDLTANGISGAGISAHAKNHVLSDENATGRTYTAMADVYNDVVRYTCCRCGASQ